VDVWDAHAHMQSRQSWRINAKLMSNVSLRLTKEIRNVTKVLLMLIVYMFYHRICWFGFFCQKSCQSLSYKSDTCTRFFFQSVLLQPLEAYLVRANNKCILGQCVVRPH